MHFMTKRTALLLIILVAVLSFVAVGARAPRSPFQFLLAQVGIVVGVAPNPYNTLDDQLNQERTQLNQQASDLAAQEAAFASSTAAANAVASPAAWYLAVAIAVVALLVVLNFYLDWRRSRSAPGVAAPLELKDVEPPSGV
jgi:uncharacterized membrane protein YwaF